MGLPSAFKSVVSRFIADESGSPAIEYSILGAVIGIACIAIFISFGDSLSNLFGSEDTGVAPELATAAQTAANS